MELHGKNLIGDAVSADGSDTTRAVDPSTSKPLDPAFTGATLEEVDRAVRLADEAFRRREGRCAELLEAIAEEILGLGDALLERAGAETGLPRPRLEGERGRTVGQLKLFANVVREGSWVDARIDRALPDRKPLPKPDVRRMLVPLGPVVVFGASNFPLAFSVAGGDTASALAAGCPVIVKAHHAHPGTSELVGRAVQAAVKKTGLHPGTFSLLHGSGRIVGQALVKHPLVRAVGFTGSQAGGRALMDAAAARPEPIPVYAEMGSVNPVFVLPGALKERGDQIAQGLVQSVSLGVGQFCTNPGLVFGTDDPTLASFTEAVARHSTACAPGTMLHSGIRDTYLAGLAALDGVAGVTVAGRSSKEPDAGRTEAPVAVLRTNAETFLADDRLREEVFGPSTLIVSCGSPEALLLAAESMAGQLTATIHGTPQDLADHAELVAVLGRRVGRLVFNGFPTGVEVCPSMTHGGPYPASSDARSTSVGTAAILRFARPLSWQNFPQEALPPELRDANPRGIMRQVDGTLTRDPA